MAQLKAAIFDLDGTLFDSMGVWKDVDIAFLARRGIVMPEDYSAALAPLGFPAAAEYTKARFHLPDDEASIMEEWNGLALDAYRNRVLLKPYAKDYLASLARRGIPAAAATASQRIFYEPALGRNGIASYFSSVTEVSEVTRGKGFPDIYLRAAEKLGVLPEECAVFEDIVPGLTGARAGGFFCVGVFDRHYIDPDGVMKHADRYIRDFSELLEKDIF